MSDYLTQVTIPSSFLKKQFALRGSELAFGRKQGWLSDHDVVDLLAWWWAQDVALTDAEQEIAGLFPGEFWRLPHLLRACIRSESSQGSAADSVWVYLLLAWFFEIRHDLNDPLGAIETVYCDFGHPREIEDLVRYMPLREGEVAGEAGLVERWRRYIAARGYELKAERG